MCLIGLNVFGKFESSGCFFKPEFPVLTGLLTKEIKKMLNCDGKPCVCAHSHVPGGRIGSPIQARIVPKWRLNPTNTEVTGKPAV